MSIHRSLRRNGAESRTRNVQTRWERLQKLQDRGRWRSGDSIYGLPKTRPARSRAK